MSIKSLITILVLSFLISCRLENTGQLLTSLSALDIRDYFGDEIYPEKWKNAKEEDNPVFVSWKLP